MMIAGIGWIAGPVCGSLRRRWQEEFKDASGLYSHLEASGVFNTPFKKVRWFGELAQHYCLASALAVRDAFDLAGQIALDPAKVGLLSLNREGALAANLNYYKDYVLSGKKSARGNLFINTLPTSPLAQVSMTFGFKGPIFHLSSAEPRMSQVMERSEALIRRQRGLNLLCCVPGEKGVISFFMKPEAPKQTVLYTGAELKGLIGHLWDLDEVLEALKVQAGISL